MIKKIIILLIGCLFCLSLFSQEFIRIMGYNLLYYGSYTSFCTENNNSHVTKAGYLRTIIDYAKPDILVVTELSPEVYYSIYILGNVLNIGGVSHYSTASVTNESGGSLANGLFYDNTKFSLVSEYVIQTDIRDLNAYKLQYKNSADSVFINIIAGHLKAGNNATDRTIREGMIEEAMKYIDSIGNNDNFLIMGDLNVYYSAEPAFQKLINPENPSYAFFDPLNQIGHWTLNPDFSNVHTQSTRTEGSCFVTGGMDDRFDFILVDEAILNGTYNVKYKNDSYVTMGQDGLRFNSSLISPVNNSLPENIIDALYNMSDHLPVYADFYFGNINNIASHSGVQNFSARLVNPVNDDFIFELKTKGGENINIDIYSILGQNLITKQIAVEKHHQGRICAKNLPDGLYIVSFSGKDFIKSYRIIKKSK